MTARRDVSRIAAAAAAGFAAGALLVAVLMRGSLTGAGPGTPLNTSAVSPPVSASSDDGGIGVLDHRGDVPVPVLAPPSAPAVDPSIAPVARLSSNPVADLRGRDLVLPVGGATRESLHGSFDDMRGSARRHEAIDMLAPRNTPVLAVDAGTIAKLFYSQAGGTTVYQFDPSSNFVYYYAHLERYADGLKEGARVSRGQLLGYVGTSGNAPKDTPHLHFAIFRLTEKKQWWQGTPIDPFEVLK